MQCFMFLTLKGYSATSVFLGQSGIYFFSQCNIFDGSPSFFKLSLVDFLVSPMENLLLGEFFPVSRAVPTGVVRQGVLLLPLNIFLICRDLLFKYTNFRININSKDIRTISRSSRHRGILNIRFLNRFSWQLFETFRVYAFKNTFRWLLLNIHGHCSSIFIVVFEGVFFNCVVARFYIFEEKTKYK